MKINKKNLSLVLTLLVTTLASTLTYSQQAKLPTIVLPSPEAAEITKYGQIPVSQFSGIPNISIPLYTIKEKDINLPIALNYHAAGIKVNDYATWIGAGWSLNAGGVISRVVKGRPDEDAYGILNTGSTRAVNINQSKYTFCESVVVQKADAESDQFFYNFSGYSGSFIFSANGNVKMSPYDPKLKISFINRDYFKITTDQGTSYYFTEKEKSTSKSESGAAPFYSSTTAWYISKIISFNGKDSVNFTYSQIGRPDDRIYNNSASIGKSFSKRTLPNDVTVIDPNDGVQKNDNTTYLNNENIKYLNKISFANGTISFVPESGARLDFQSGYILKNVIIKNNNNKTIKTIRLDHDYFYNSGTTSTGTSNGFNPYAYEEDKYRLKLLAVNEIDTNNVIIDKYRMAYDETNLLPPRKNCGIDYWGYYNGHPENQTLLCAEDGGHIEHYDGRDYDLVVYGKRDADESFMKTNVLTRIYYPTGGYTNFEFESNKIYTPQANFETRIYNASAKLDDIPNDPFRINTFVADTNLSTSLVLNVPLYNDQNKPAAIFEDLTSASYTRFTTFPGQQTYQSIPINLIKGHTYRLTAQLITTGAANEDPDLEVLMNLHWDKLSNLTNVLKNVGGLRVKSIKNYNSDGTLVGQEVYKYGQNENGAGNLSFFPGIVNRKSFLSNYVYGFTIYTGANQGISFLKTTKKEIVANPVYNLSNYEGGLCAYTSVTKYVGINASDLQKTTYTYDFELDDQVDDSRNTSKPTLISNEWRSGSLIKEEQFKNIGGVFSLAKKRSYTYNIINKDTTYSLGISRQMIHTGDVFFDQSNTGNNVLPNNVGNASVGEDYNYFDYPFVSGVKLLVQETDSLYENSGTTATKQNYSYGNLNHIQPTLIQTTDSKNQTISTSLKYPAEMVSLGKDPTGIYAAMISKNQITPVIETTKSTNGAQTYLERNNYYLTGYSLAEPQSLEIQNGLYAVEPRIKYKTHNDRGDILTLGYVAGPDIGYQWGYNGQYPVAKASNAMGTEILFSSFDETGTWDSSLSAYDANFKRSGVYSGRIDNTNTSEKTSVNRTWLAVSLTAAKKFHYAGWVYSNGPTADIYLLMKRAGETGYVTYADFATTSAVGKWTYLEKDFLVPADVTQMTLRVDNNGALNGGTQVWFDDMRLYPFDAQMTTYTYDPLVGMTSTTDPKGETTYYEYDSFQRLKNIKDQYGNILKSYDYNYRP